MTNRTVLSPDDSGYLRQDNFFIQSFYEEGFLVALHSSRLDVVTTDSLEVIIQALEKTFDREEIYIKHGRIVAHNDKGAAQINYINMGEYRSLNNYIFTFAPADFLKFEASMADFTRYIAPPKEPNGMFEVKDYYIDSIKRIRKHQHNMSSKSMNGIRDDLYPGIDIPKLVNSYLDSNENILILVGKPGTGKTTMMKRILQEMSYNSGNPRTLYTKDMNVLRLPDFWSETLPSEKPKFLVLDDLDKELTPRTEVGSNIIVNQILSLSDGLFESKMKIIITTNLVDEGIDPAVLRPGRCYDVLDLPYLTTGYAFNMWITVDQRTEAEWHELFPEGEAHVTQALYMANLESLQDGNPKSYLLDKTISARDKYMKAS
jgi:hypothetical protein